MIFVGGASVYVWQLANNEFDLNSSLKVFVQILFGICPWTHFRVCATTVFLLILSSHNY
jgi:hypothetical protein